MSLLEGRGLKLVMGERAVEMSLIVLVIVLVHSR